ncbi:MAG: hypothetical protein ACRDHS_06335 [Actinomycetota bacterium]
MDLAGALADLQDLGVRRGTFSWWRSTNRRPSPARRKRRQEREGSRAGGGRQGNNNTGRDDATGCRPREPIPSLCTPQATTRACAVPGIAGLELTIGPGRHVIPLPEGDRYLGFLFARADGPEEVEDALRTAHGHLEIVIGAQE